MSIGSKKSVDYDFAKASARGDFEWKNRISRPKQAASATGRDLGENPTTKVRHDPDWYKYDTGKPGPLPRKSR